jgi:hypothetical protein
MAKRLISTPPEADTGSEAGVGFDFQWHLAAGKCIEMLSDEVTEYVVCEFHEDIIQIKREGVGLDLIQVKKKESGTWSMNDLLKPEKKQKKGILAKLFEHLEAGKDIRSISLVGHGRCSGDEDCSLPNLIALLGTPEAARDGDWRAHMEKFTNFLAEELEAQGISAATVAKGLELLRIDFSFPHPDAMASKGEGELDALLRQVFNVDLSLPEVKEVYNDLYNRVKAISLKPKQPWEVKSISREAASAIIYKRLKQYKPLATRDQYKTLQEKLSSAKLKERVDYAIEKRLDAIILKYELNIKPAQWEDYKADINVEWQAFLTANPTVKGPHLWKGVREVFSKLGGEWEARDSRLGAEFVEGVFFDMTAICEATWKG